MFSPDGRADGRARARASPSLPPSRLSVCLRRGYLRIVKKFIKRDDKGREREREREMTSVHLRPSRRPLLLTYKPGSSLLYLFSSLGKEREETHLYPSQYSFVEVDVTIHRSTASSVIEKYFKRMSGNIQKFAHYVAFSNIFLELRLFLSLSVTISTFVDVCNKLIKLDNFYSHTSKRRKCIRCVPLGATNREKEQRTRELSAYLV